VAFFYIRGRHDRSLKPQSAADGDGYATVASAGHPASPLHFVGANGAGGRR